MISCLPCTILSSLYPPCPPDVHISPHLCFSLFCCPHASLEDMDLSRHAVVVHYFPLVCLRLLWLPTYYDGLHATSNCVCCRAEHCRPLLREKSTREATPLTGKTSNETKCLRASVASVVLLMRVAFLFYAFLFRAYRRSSHNVRPRVSRSFVWCMLLSLIAAHLASFVFVFNSVGRSSRC